MTVIDKGLKRKVFVALAAVFVLGIAVGSMATGGYIWYRFKIVIEGGPAVVRKFLVDHLTGELHLSAEQSEKLDPLIRRVQEELAKYRVKTRLTTDRMLLPLIQDISAILDPEQKVAFDKIMKRLESKFDNADKELLGEVEYAPAEPDETPSPQPAT